MAKTTAYVLIELKECDEQKVIQKLIEIPEVEEAHILFGEWDLIVKLSTNNTEDISTIIMDKIRKLPEVKISSTMIVAR
ncbi:MAG: Lrp/AsnC ligand binding domain-containing protein [Candidatus Woesearchaeota archaeon]